MYSNLTVSDQLNIGCDRFNGVETMTACQDAALDYRSRTYDFYSVVAPPDPRLPGGGGYRILGLTSAKPGAPAGQPIVQTQMEERDYVWNGVDTNFVWRGPWRPPRQRRHQHRPHAGRHLLRDARRTQCQGARGRRVPATAAINEPPWQTRVNGTAAYTDPVGGRARQHGVPVVPRRRTQRDDDLQQG